MVLLADGIPASWSDSMQLDLRTAARAQLARSCPDAAGDPTIWGDEVEYTLLDANGRLRLGAYDMRPCTPTAGHYMVEYASWMIEGVPRDVYTTPWQLEANLRARRDELTRALPAGLRIVTTTVHRDMGRGAFFAPTSGEDSGVRGPLADSDTVADACITPHPRFAALTRNIRARRGDKVRIRLDTLGGAPLTLDAMAYGMGCCSLQVTTQARDLAHALRLHDAFALLTPVFLALTAATPAIAGVLLDSDVRWHIIRQSVDDRTPDEAGTLPPRFDMANFFVAPEGQAFNDEPLAVDDATYQTLLDTGTAPPLATLMAHILRRDPLVVFPDRVADGAYAMDTFLSTHWKSVRLKPPGGEVAAWRVEFRPMELQPDDFKNAAFGTLAVLMARALADTTLPYTKISQLRRDVDLACTRGAARANVALSQGHLADVVGDVADPGSLMGRCHTFVERLEDGPAPEIFARYAAFVTAVARGQTPTTAEALRAAASPPEVSAP